MPIRPRRAALRAVLLPLCLLLGTATTPAASAAPTPTAAPSDDYAAIDAYVRDRMEATGTPGLSYAVVGPEGPLHRRSWGTDGRGRPVTARTPFLWGSVAKPVAATAVTALVQDGRLGLDDRVTDHLPRFRFGGAGHASRVTVGDLLRHTSGIPASATSLVTDCYAADCPAPAGRLGALDGAEPLGPPGGVYAYTSANYLVLAAVVEAVTGRSFADHLEESVLGPAGMDSAFADRASAARRGLTPGHQLLWGRPAAIADGVDDHGAAYGYLGGDLDDLAAFAAFQLRTGTTADGEPVLTPATVRLMREETVLRPGGAGTGYGAGWRVGGLDAPLDRAVWHTGATPGHSAMLFLLPERGTALVLQQNLYGLLQDEEIMAVGFGAARMLAGGTAPTDGASVSPYDLAIWGTTALALAMVVAACRSALLLRRRVVPSSVLRRTTSTVLWFLAGAAPCAGLLVVIDRVGLGQMTTWLPDVTVAAGVAAVAGAVTAVLRLVLVTRAPRARADVTGAAPERELSEPRALRLPG
ncbi:serine hydrolase domain-containing protein [Streptomyces avicenniae]|uniref:serine hydrolase domain-containing protein n=1 Tax=Streptomyces avicenniae TaxID=500153 RepID=UPI000B1DBF1A|nr:serine hydrolase domain-containing protein [Streptomyces avicenniae]